MRLRPAALILGALGMITLGACGRGSSAPGTETGHGPYIYTSDETGGHVVVVDPAARAVVERISVGKRPRGIVLSRDGTQLFVALSGSPIAGPGVDESKLPPADRSADGIGVVDLATAKLVRKYKSGRDPESFALSPDGNTLYVSNEETASMTALDLRSGDIRGDVKVGADPEGVTVRPDGKVVYVTSEAENEVVAVDTADLTVAAKIPTAARPRAIVFTSDGSTAFVTNENGGAVTVVDAVRHVPVATIQVPRPSGADVPARPMGAALSPDGHALFVTLGRAQSIAVIDTATRAVARTITDVGARPWGIGLSADGRTLYTANGPSGDVSLVNVASGQVEARIPVGGSPWGIAVAGR